MTPTQIAAELRNAKATDAEHPLMKSFRLNGGLRQEDLVPEEVTKADDNIIRVEGFKPDA